MPEVDTISPFIDQHSCTVDIDDVVIYDAQDVGEFSEGSVVMSNRDCFGLWSVSEFSRVENPARFEYDRGVWVQTVEINDVVLAERHQPVPPVNRPLTELQADNE